MARRARVAAFACALAFVESAALAGLANAQTYATLHVRHFTMNADHATVALGERFNLTIATHVDEVVVQLDNLTLPDLSGFDSFGDERRCSASSAMGSDCVETVTLAATSAGQRTIAGATLDAIDGRNGKPSRFTTDPVSILVTAPIPVGDPNGNVAAGMIAAFIRAAIFVMLVALALIVLAWAFLSKRKTSAVVPAPSYEPQPLDPNARFRELAAALLREPTRANALRLRAALRETMGAREDETLEDLMRRTAGTPDDRATLRAVESAAFCEDARVAAAVGEARPFLIR